MNKPTPAQYCLGVNVGHAVVSAMDDGATCDEVIATLRHNIAVMERNRDAGVDMRREEW